jgi:hypothetical protein
MLKIITNIINKIKSDDKTYLYVIIMLFLVVLLAFIIVDNLLLL